jgi:hypothetical protein
MSRSTQRLTVESGRRGLFNRAESVELLGVSLRQPDHFTRLLPNDGDNALPLLMLPVRLLALAVLWATSAPRRTLLAVLLLAALAIAAH